MRKQARSVAAPVRLSSWSFSTHKQMERCPARTKYAKIDHLPDPSGPAAERGNRIGKALELYVLGEGAFPMDVLAWKPAIDERVAMGEVGVSVIPEREFAFDHRWEPVPWDEALIRGKPDLLTIVDDETVEVLDYKTGQQYADHADQLELYAVYVLRTYPWCNRVLLADWYLDRPGEVLEHGPILRADYEGLLAKWKKIVVADLSRSVWPAQRNLYCKYCPFSSKRGGPCTEGG